MRAVQGVTEEKSLRARRPSDDGGGIENRRESHEAHTFFPKCSAHTSPHTERRANQVGDLLHHLVATAYLLSRCRSMT